MLGQDTTTSVLHLDTSNKIFSVLFHNKYSDIELIHNILLDLNSLITRITHEI